MLNYAFLEHFFSLVLSSPVIHADAFAVCLCVFFFSLASVFAWKPYVFILFYLFRAFNGFGQIDTEFDAVITPHTLNTAN